MVIILDVFIMLPLFRKYLVTSKCCQKLGKDSCQDSENTFKSLNNLRNNSSIIILSADKETYRVILNRTDYIKKVNAMIDDYISQGKYVETGDNKHQDLKLFQNLLHRHFLKTEYYDKMRPIFNQPVRFFATAKTRKFNKIEDINIKDLKVRPKVDQTGTYLYNASKVITN